MKKIFYWLLSAIFILCGVTVFTSCSNDDDNSASIPAFPQPGDTWDAATGTLYVNSNPGKACHRQLSICLPAKMSILRTSKSDSPSMD